MDLIRQKTKTHQRKILYSVIYIISVLILILEIKLVLLLKFLVFNKQATNDTTNVQIPCQNACLGGNFNVTYLNGQCICNDINECLSPTLNKCHSLGQVCLNSYGSYICYCGKGFLQINNSTCVDINECDKGVCNPALTTGCINIPGSYMCECAIGFTWNRATNLCTDFDECLNNTNICGKSEICINTIGSFLCNCSTGYDLVYSNNQQTCVEINECNLNSTLYMCPYPYSCKNTDGTYTCCSNNNNNEVCQSCGLQYANPSLRIIGGINAVPNSWPWIVSIGKGVLSFFFLHKFETNFF